MCVAQVGQNLFVTIVARVKTLEIGLVIGLVTTQINIHVGVSPMKSFFCTATILALKSQHVTFMEVMSKPELNEEGIVQITEKFYPLAANAHQVMIPLENVIKFADII